MSSVDSRIVTMKFDNAQFEKGASTTMSTLDKLKASLNFTGATKGLTAVQGAIDKVDLHGMEGGITRISGAFVALGTVAVTALSNITSKAMEVGSTLVQQLTGIQAMQDGFSDYELKVGATQTIMSGTGEDIATVTKYLKELDTYADQTIYNLRDMTGNLSKFTNAGVKLPVAVEAMKGIGNLAARSGANSQQAAQAMYNFGQAIGEGSLKLMDWNSIEIADMGTIEFKQQLIDTAVAMGTLKKAGDGVYKTLEGTKVTTKTFQTTLKDGWATAEVLTETLGRYADETEGIGKKSFKSAKDVKTFSMMMETLKAAAGTGWTDTFETVIGNLPEATELWTGLTNAIGGFIGASADARNKVLGDWKELGGRTAAIEGIKNVFEAIGAVLKPIKDAFRDIFPAKTGKQLYDATIAFRNFTEHLKIGKDTAENLKRTFRGVFAVFSIVWTVIKAVAGAFGQMFAAISSAVAGGGGGLTTITANIGDVIAGFDSFLKKTDIVAKSLGAVGKAIGTVIGFLIQLAKSFTSLFTGETTPFLDSLIARFEAAGPIIDKLKQGIKDFVNTVKGIASTVASAFGFGEEAEKSSGGLQAINDSLGETTSLIDKLKAAWDKFITSFVSLKKSEQPVMEGLKERLGGFLETLKEAFGNIGLQDVLSIINTLIFGGFIKTLRDFVKSISGMANGVSDVLGAVTDNLKAMQKEVKAKALLKIAIGLLLLAAAVVILSQIDPMDLAKGIVAVALMMKIMTKALAELDEEVEKGSSKEAIAGGARLVLMAGAIVLLGLAMIAFAAALKIIGSIPLAELAKGVGTIIIIMGVLVGAAKLFEMSGGAASLLQASTSLLILSVALLALAGALLLWDQLDATTVLDSIWKVALVLGVLSGVMQLFPKKGQLVKAAVSIFILALALNLLALALKQIDSISAGGLIKSITAIAAALVILVAAVLLMNVAKSGAKNMVIVSASLMVLAVALKLLSTIPWQGLLIALGAIAGVFVILGLAGLILGPLTPVILLLAAALGILGLAMMAIGAGFALFAAGLVALAALGTPALLALINLLPVVGAQIGLAIAAWAKVIGDAAPVIGEAIYKLIMAIIDTVKKLLPEIPPLMKAMLDTFLKVMKDAVPRLADAALNWLVKILESISRNIYRITTVTIEIITKFLKGLNDGLPQLVDQGVALIVTWLDSVSSRENVKKITDAAFDAIDNFANGVMDAIEDPENQKQFKETGRRMGGLLVDGLKAGLTSGAALGGLWGAGGALIRAIKGGAEEEGEISSPSKVFFRMGKDIDQGLANGLVAYSDIAVDAGQGVAKDTIDVMKSTMAKVSDAISDDINMNPVITPVLDLTQFREDVARMGTALDARTMANVSLRQAASIANERGLTQAPTDAPFQPQASVIQFEQNNYSPKALSPADIYRQTKNQLSLAKEALSV